MFAKFVEFSQFLSSFSYNFVSNFREMQRQNFYYQTWKFDGNDGKERLIFLESILERAPCSLARQKQQWWEYRRGPPCNSFNKTLQKIPKEEEKSEHLVGGEWKDTGVGMPGSLLSPPIYNYRIQASLCIIQLMRLLAPLSTSIRTWSGDLRGLYSRTRRFQSYPDTGEILYEATKYEARTIRWLCRNACDGDH